MKPALIDNPAAGEAPDPFDLASLRLNQSFIETVGTRKLVTTVPVRKPNPQDFVRVHPDAAYRADFALIDLREEREQYLLPTELVPALATEAVFATLFTAVNRQGVVFLWPVRLPPADGKQNEWWRSAREAAERAMSDWLRVKANLGLGAY